MLHPDRNTMAGKCNNNNGPTSSTEGRLHSNALSRHASGREQLQSLVSRYTRQLLVGCQSPECFQIACHTGRVNSSKAPVRKYTPRSAKAIAISICSGPQPQRHMCLYGGGDDDPSAYDLHVPPGPQDQSSLVQLVCDSTSKNQCIPSKIAIAQDLKSQHSRLDHVLAQIGSCNGHNVLISNIELVGSILPWLQWLVERLPAQKGAIWHMVDRDIVSNGFEVLPRIAASPNNESLDSCLASLDVINHEIYLRFLRRVLTIVAKRLALEQQLISIRARCELEDEMDSKKSSRKGLASCLAAIWLETHEKNANDQIALVVWLKKLFTQCWAGTSTVTVGTVPHAILQIFREMRRIGRTGSAFRNDSFELRVIQRRIDEVDLATSWLSLQERTHSHLFEFPFLFAESQVFRYFRTINHLRMRSSHSATLSVQALRDRISQLSIPTHEPAQLFCEEQHYLLLYVSRENIVQDAFDQIWERRRGELRRPLRVRMGADELDIGHDLGGVQVEFFQVFCRKVFEEEAQMFTTDATTGISYFCAYSLQPLHMYELFGTLLALAVYNGITLPIRLPQVFYHFLVGSEEHEPDVCKTVDSIRDAWPSQARSFDAILEQDIDDLEFAFPLEAQGVRMTVMPFEARCTPSSDSRIQMKVIDMSRANQNTAKSPSLSEDIAELAQAWPGWTLIESDEQAQAVTRDNKSHYIGLYVSWLSYSSVAPQLRATLKGFRASEVIDLRSLSILGAENLKSLVEGTDYLDIWELKRATRYEGYEASSKYMRIFWSIVTRWPEKKQKQLLKFVTAAERIPITGTENLTFIIKRSNPESLESLPTSSTCFGTLMLPRYGSAQILAAKLNLALEYGAEGFGTG